MPYELIFILQEDGTIRPLPLRLFSDLAHGIKGLPEYAGRAVRAIDFWIDNLPNGCSTIQKVGTGHYFKFDRDGRMLVGDGDVDTSGEPWGPNDEDLEIIRGSLQPTPNRILSMPRLGHTLQGSDAAFSIVSTKGEPNLASSPSVGIFWGARGLESAWWVIINEKSTLDDSESYGDFLTYAHGHYEIWDQIKEMDTFQLIQAGLPLTVSYNEYEEPPRGRIVFHKPDQRFIVYADARLHVSIAETAITRAFGLVNCRYEFKYDEHYK
jgi:hypothetical protein